jgi:asparagine synthase (glutamine-hydrolysing)
MCGIAGIVGEAARDTALLKRMVGSLAHRGPDDEGVWVDGEAGVGFAHRRLSIVDLSPAGHQPLLSANGRFVLNFNGEIYNHAEVRAELDAAGGRPEGGWRGHSDTETLVEAIALWGLEAALGRCVGMFAFALWDKEARRLSLVRDRFGEKPLYYGWAGRDLVFASELKAIRGHPRFAGEIDREALSLFTARTYVPAPLSIYRGIFKLEPGCILELTADAARRPLSEPPRLDAGGGVSLSRYWSYREVVRAGLADPIADEGEAVDWLEAALGEAIRGQSIADVPVGAFLSGGIDSSSVVALYQKYSPQPVRTFTIGFAEAAYNEAGHAREVARVLGTDHHERIVTPAEARDVLPKLPAIYDEPFADASQIPTYLVSAFAREQVKVSLSGDGGDVLFGGYNRYFAIRQLWSRLSVLPRPMRALAGATLGRISPAAWNRIARAIRRRPVPASYGEKVRRWVRTTGEARGLEEIVAVLLDRWRGESPVLGRGEATRPANFDLNLDLPVGAADPVRMMYCDALGYLPDDILCKVDRASMAVGLEGRVPFLDHRVAAVAARIPLALKIRGGTGKLVLRQMLYREAPRALFERPKAGFGIPVGEWIRGPLRDWAEALLDPRRVRGEGWFDPELVAREWRDHLSGARDSTEALWGILMFQAWLDDRDAMRAVAA